MSEVKHYTNVYFSRNRIFVRGFDENWNPVITKVPFTPTVWVDPTNGYHQYRDTIVNADAKKWKTFIGKHPLVGLTFKDISSCRKFVSDNRKYEKVDGKMKVVSEKVYTPPSNMFICQYISENFTTEPVPMEKLRVYTYDIETEVGHRNVPDDSKIKIRKITDNGSMFEQKSQQLETTISEYELHPDKDKWEILNEESGEWVSYDVHPFRFIGGFPHPSKAEEKVTLITVKDINGSEIHTWGLKDFTTDRKDIHYYKCKSEDELLRGFLSFWSQNYPDIGTSWNGRLFDNTYLYNRIKIRLGEEEAKRLSPFGEVFQKQIEGTDDVETTFGGIADLDYLKLYRKFNTKAQENYKLDTIANLEIGFKKVENPTGGSFRDFYTGQFEVRQKPKDDDTEIRKMAYERTKLYDHYKETGEGYEEWEALDKKIRDLCAQTFIEYNIRDVELVDKIDNKRKYINLAMTIAYSAQCNYEDVFSPVKTWDYIIYNHLIKDGIVVPIKKPANKTEKFEGAYVKPPLIGKHEFCASFDLDSLLTNSRL